MPPFAFPKTVHEIKLLVGKANHLHAEVAALRNGAELLEPLCDSLLSSTLEDPFRPSTAMVVAPSSKKGKKALDVEERPAKKPPGKVSGYNLFMKKNISKQRDRLTALGQDPTSKEAKSEILKKLGADWKNLDADTKQRYKVKADKVNADEGRGIAKVSKVTLEEEPEE